MEVEEFAVPAAVVEDRPDFDLRGRRTGGGSEVCVGCDWEAGALVASGSLDAGQTAVEVVRQVTQRPRLTSDIQGNVLIFSVRGLGQSVADIVREEDETERSRV